MSVDTKVTITAENSPSQKHSISFWMPIISETEDEIKKLIRRTVLAEITNNPVLKAHIVQLATKRILDLVEQKL